jgi:hypothetical protein
MGIIARQLASDIDVSRSSIGELVNSLRPVAADTALRLALFRRTSDAQGRVQRTGSRVLQDPIDLDRSRKVRFPRTAWKPAPLLVPRALTVRVTVKEPGRGESPGRDIYSGTPLMIEWE